MSNKLILQYVDISEKNFNNRSGFRIYIKDGIVKNPDVATIVESNLDTLTAARIRQTKLGSRRLILSEE